MKSVLQLALFLCFAVHSLPPVAMLFNIFHKLKEIRVLRPIFPDYDISCDYAYIYIAYYINNSFYIKPNIIYKITFEFTLYISYFS